MQFNFVLGVSAPPPRWATWLLSQADPRRFHLDRHRRRPGRVAHGGRGHRHGRHNVRVGFEDSIYLEKGHKAASNGELVEEGRTPGQGAGP